jgi:trans-aconitate methyltransferase
MTFAGAVHSPAPRTNDRAARDFENFLEAHPLYKSALNKLAASSRLLEMSAQLVYETHGEAVGRAADDILAFVERTHPQAYIERYISRANDLSGLQEQFDSNPSVLTLGDSNAVVDSETYSLSLLLSILFTNHRFEIMQELVSYFKLLQVRSAPGKIVSIGSGTGYELKLASEILIGWEIQSYDTDPMMQMKSRQLLDFFQISRGISIEGYFPLNQCADDLRNRYDGVVLCEVLEHLPAPALSLLTLREYLKNTGLMFVTMAINIAQEDHIFLYDSVDSCRLQIQQSGFKVLKELISPQSVFALPENREKGFKKGNYVAVLEKC